PPKKLSAIFPVSLSGSGIMPEKKNVMKKHPLIAFALLSLLFIYSCGNKNKTGTADGTNDTIPEIIDSVATLTTEAECGNLQPGQFCSNGLDILRLGDSLVWNNNIKSSLPDGTLKDTIFSEVAMTGQSQDTVSWFVKMLRLPDGIVYLEADFNNEHLLGRIRIESGRYHHVSGLRVGSSGKELKAAIKDAYVIPFTERGIFEVIVPYQTGKMIFHFPQEGIYDPAKHNYALTDIPDEAKVVRIVLM
ncbi:MAG: hypothetical protein KA293_12315, partial [Bacteroidia bacterium]|nr:hypothetical protein [Bacteroidia bacterium]